MSSEWHAATLAEIALTGKTGLVDGPFGSNLPSSSYTQQGIPVIRGSNLTKGKERFKSGEFVYVSSQTAEALSRSCCIPGDIIFTKKGTLGQIGLIPSGGHPVYLLSSNQMRLRVDATKADPEFVYYYLAQPDSIEKIIRDSEHTGVPKINLGYVKSFPISLPTVKTQRHIAATLSALDDRITLLRETNATLEAIAQALFKSWFVDFDPVRAKLEGRAPEGMDEATAALFPDSFEESELGLVPKGWKPLLVSEVSEIVKGKSYSSKDLVTEHETALVTLKSFARGGGFRLDGFKPYAGTYKESQVVVSGDLIVAYTDVTQAAELIGKPAIVIGVDEYRTLVASLDVGIIRPLISKVSRQFLFGLFNSDAFQAHTLSHTSGTTVLHLSKDGVGSYKFVCPPLSVVDAFSDIAESLTSRQQVNIDQMRNLATLRDTLLPRLISGRLRLPVALATVEEALA